ncbi:MAG: hypothetical protein ABSH09_35530 [Bryobacteraceae bacterium]|jgi:hypothetical protein
MMELLSKAFWQGVKKTFQEGLEGPPKTGDALPAPADDQPHAVSDQEPSPSPAEGSESLTRCVEEHV